MKKAIALMLALTLLLLPGCGSDLGAYEPTGKGLTWEEDDPHVETTEEVIEVIKSDFEIYQSNSITPSSCNYALKTADGTPVRATFRGVYNIQEFGELEYKFYFSNNVDSTFSNGSHSYRAMKTDPYKIISATVGTTSKAFGTGKIDNAQPLTFDGSTTRDVEGGEMFWSDSVSSLNSGAACSMTRYSFENLFMLDA